MFILFILLIFPHGSRFTLCHEFPFLGTSFSLSWIIILYVYAEPSRIRATFQLNWKTLSPKENSQDEKSCKHQKKNTKNTMWVNDSTINWSNQSIRLLPIRLLLVPTDIALRITFLGLAGPTKNTNSKSLVNGDSSWATHEPHAMASSSGIIWRTWLPNCTQTSVIK